MKKLDLSKGLNVTIDLTKPVNAAIAGGIVSFTLIGFCHVCKTIERKFKKETIVVLKGITKEQLQNESYTIVKTSTLFNKPEKKFSYQSYYDDYETKGEK